MKSILKYIRLKPFLGILVLLLIFAMPSLLVGWSLVDDGKSAEVAHNLSLSISKLNLNLFWTNLLEPDSGRFRPAYWLYQWITFLISGRIAFLHYFIHILIFGTTTFIIYKLAKKNGLFWSGILSATFFILDFRLLENWYRLGPQEPIQLLLLISSLFFFILYRENFQNRWLKLSYLSLILGFFYKETSLAYVAVPAYLFIFDFITTEKKYYKTDAIYLILALTMGLLIRLIPALTYSQSGYSGLYDISITAIIDNLRNYIFMLRSGYSPLLELMLFVFLIRIFFELLNLGIKDTLRKNFYSILFFVWFLSFFIIQLPWGFTIGRYLQVALAGLFIFLGIEISLLLSNLNLLLKDKYVIGRIDIFWLVAFIKISLIGLLILIYSYQILMSLSYIQWVLGVSDFNTAFIKEAVNATPSRGTVYLDADYIGNPPLELYKETGWHFKYLYNREDIIYDYLPKNYTLKKDDVVLIHTSKPLYSAEELMKTNDLKLVGSKTSDVYSIVYSAPLGLIKEIPKTLLDVSREEQLDKKPISKLFSISKYTYKWEVYQVQ